MERNGMENTRRGSPFAWSFGAIVGAVAALAGTFSQIPGSIGQLSDGDLPDYHIPASDPMDADVVDLFSDEGSEASAKWEDLEKTYREKSSQ